MGTIAIVPPTLDVDGAALWSSITAAYDLRADELTTLEDICELTDMISGLRAAWIEAGKPRETKGSMGQQVIHPLIEAMKTHRMARNSLWRQLKLPDAPAAGAAAPNQARAAAQSRWSAAHGAGA